MKIKVSLDGASRWYTYAVPDDVTVAVGDTVTVPGLWTETTTGVVREIGSDYDGPLTTILGVTERAS